MSELVRCTKLSIKLHQTVEYCILSLYIYVLGRLRNTIDTTHSVLITKLQLPNQQR